MKILKYVSSYTIYVDILFPLTKAIPIMREGVTTHYQTLKTWIGHNATHNHNCNMLPHALTPMLPYIFLQFSMAWGYLQCVTVPVNAGPCSLLSCKP